MGCTMQMFICLLGCLFLTVELRATCCKNYGEVKSAINECEEEAKSMEGKYKDSKNQICYGLICVVKKWGLLENGTFNVKKEEMLFKKIFPEASAGVTSKLLECSAAAIDEKDECQVLVKTYNCLFDSSDHRMEIDALIQKREDEHN
ncbi:uncharacterized protein LOC106639198 [Copidosoma floridanum]|uniref:uncharacterized protein LOC106639183 n=1 Tax=Copidosoma floridanum TaxID=29053 RepID=UPI0006C94A74|nr:uncharacterized protein LOC106639183 [Copidosoma floridanum]XP_014208185.1 uncharacterized protein LOC106639198 [Copidosoma floridanum]